MSTRVSPVDTPPREEAGKEGADRTTAEAVVAVVDDDPVLRHWLSQILDREGLQTRSYSTAQEALDRIDDDVDVVCLDLGLEDMSGLEVLKRLRARATDPCVIVVTAEARAEVAVEAMRAGAYDYLVKPLEPERVKRTVGRAVERQLLRREVARLKSAPEGDVTLVGVSEPIRELRRQIERIADSDVTVCLQGETGTGKEVVARVIHQSSRRRRGPFVAINCAALPESLEEAELFGHEKGAFTGALGMRKGRFEQANGGTLFLDEVGDMAMSTQTALLRTLQQRAVTRVGGSAEIPVDVRVISATHRDLRAEVLAGRFRQDLYYRLVVYPLQLPPLRERGTDIPALVAHFLRKLQRETRTTVDRVSPEALAALGSYDWPGNVRELENVVQRALLACDGPEVELRHLPPELRGEGGTPPPPRPSSKPPGPGRGKTAGARRLQSIERTAIQQALAEAGGNVAKAATLLGMSRATLYRRLATMDDEEG